MIVITEHMWLLVLQAWQLAEGLEGQAGNFLMQKKRSGREYLRHML